MADSYYKLVVYVPTSHADAVRDAIGKAHGGKIGDYTYCSFSSPGTGRFVPGADSKPFIGTSGRLEKVSEERIEVSVEKNALKDVIEAMKRVHPYEEVAFDVYECLRP